MSRDDTDASRRLTHLDERGRANMVDVTAKPATRRVARAEAVFRADAEACRRLWSGELAKGEALAVARVAGIQAAKETSRLIPLCHPLALSRVAVSFERVGEEAIRVGAEAVTVGPTGVEMEAMTAASVAALTLYDMVKSVCRTARIEGIRLRHKSGGRSGEWNAPEDGRQA